MAIDFGLVKPGLTLYVPFDSFAGSTGASITLTGLAVTDIEIYKDGSVTQRSSDAGYTLLDTDGIDFDGITGIHGFSINLADNTDAGFYASGSRYFVVVSTVTVDSQTVSFVACTFSIGHPDAVLSTTIATLSTQTSFTLTAGPAEDDALNGMWAIIHDVASAVQMSIVQISDYTGSTKTVTLAAGATFTAAATDNFLIMGPMPLQPTVGAIQSPGRTLDVTTGGEAGIDWNNVGTPGATVSLSATTVSTVTTATNVTTVNGLAANVITATSIQADAITAAKIADNAIDAGAIASDAITAAKIADGAIDAATFAAGAITASAIAADAITDAKVASDVTIASVTGAVGSVTGAVGSVTGNVGGNVTGSVGSLATQAKADVNAEVLDVLNTDTFAEPGQGSPAATTTLVAKIGYLYKAWRNRSTQTSSEYALYADDATTKDQEAAVSDNGTTYERGEVTTGA